MGSDDVHVATYIHKPLSNTAMCATGLKAFEKVVNYATATSCRRRLLLQHFGKTLQATQCTGCDYCNNPGTVLGQASVFGHSPDVEIEPAHLNAQG